MKKLARCVTAALAVILAGAAVVGSAVAQEKPRYGGELIFPVPSEPPSYDAHREQTFGVIHPVAPHYNGLLQVDPTDPSGTKPAPDLAADGARDHIAFAINLARRLLLLDAASDDLP